MPARMHSADRVGGISDYCIVNGINLNDFKIAPEHNRILESLLVGVNNPFSIKHLETVKIETWGAVKDYSYVAMWNVAVAGVSGKSVRPTKASATLRKFEHNGHCCGLTLCDFIDTMCPRQNNGIRKESARIEIPCDIISILSEEGILENDARIALSSMIRDREIGKEILRTPGILSTYGDDRRRIVSRILNRINGIRSGGR